MAAHDASRESPGPAHPDESLEEARALERRCREALAAKKSLPFAELCRLAEDAGFVRDRHKGSHTIYKHPDYILDMRLRPSDRMNFQPNDNKAKPYQVAELVEFIRLAVKKN